MQPPPPPKKKEPLNVHTIELILSDLTLQYFLPPLEGNDALA